MQNSNTISKKKVGVTAKVGSVLLMVWSIIHLISPFLVNAILEKEGPAGVWNFFLGGAKAPLSAFVYATDAVTKSVQKAMLLNLAFNFGAMGLVGLIASIYIFKHGSWMAYFVAAILMGINEFAYVYLMIVAQITPFALEKVFAASCASVGLILVPFGLCCKPSTEKSKKKQ